MHSCVKFVLCVCLYWPISKDFYTEFIRKVMVIENIFISKLYIRRFTSKVPQCRGNNAYITEK